MNVNAASFLFFKTNQNSLEVLRRLKERELMKWVTSVYGPYQIVGYMEMSDYTQLVKSIESLRCENGVTHLDARMVKNIPEDSFLKDFKLIRPERSVLLINVNYRVEKERVVTLQLRKLSQIVLARAMWGPSDIIAVAEADDHESMRNLICDQVKVLPGVQSNTTLYCYQTHL
jgi:DNA-binding Lrp family transcriptional regulator